MTSRTKVSYCHQAAALAYACGDLWFQEALHVQVLFTEAVSNPTLVVANLPTLAEIAHSKVCCHTVVSPQVSPCDFMLPSRKAQSSITCRVQQLMVVW